MNSNTAQLSYSYNTSRVRDYFSLLKPRVMALVVFTGFAGIYLAPGYIHPFIATVAIFCIALGAGASGAINMWIERDTDALMRRTENRAIPSGRILPQDAIEFAVIMAVVSVIIMATFVNYIAASLLLFAILFYVFVYTLWLKPRTPQNIVIGGLSGALPPVIGWAAVTGNISLEPIILCLIIFLWTPPHFWAIALYRSDDYKKAGIPMLPVVSGINETKKQMLIYTAMLIPATFAPYFLGMTGFIYIAGAAVLGAVFLYYMVSVFMDNRENSANKTAFKAFKYSVLYMFMIFVFLIIDHAAQ